MNKPLGELEAKDLKFCVDNHISDPRDLVGFTETNNLGVQIEKG